MLSVTYEKHIYYCRRRPAQALYKPPRRSKNSEVSSPMPASSPPSPPPPPLPPLTTTSVEDVQENNSNTKPTKSKTARPSVEPYVPPSRRSQTLNNEPVSSPAPSAASINTNKKEDDDQGAEDEEEWEKLLDNTNDLVAEVKFQR